jgi:hypothetical protein
VTHDTKANAARHSWRRAGAIASGALILVAFTNVVLPSVAAAAGAISVTTQTDLNGTGPGCSLRDAILSANLGSNVGGCTGTDGTTDTISVPAGTYDLSAGELDAGTYVGADITIQGAGSATTTIQQTSPTARVFNLDPYVVGSVAISISGVTISGGEAQAFGGGAILGGGPGDTLTLANSVVSGNGCSGNNSGAGINWSPAGNVTITDSTFSDNTCGEAGGAIVYTASGGTLDITGSTFTDNSAGAAGSAGGALFLGQSGDAATTFTVSNSTFTENHATNASGIGGAIYVGSGSLTASFNRIVGNTAGLGGGMGIRGGTTVATDDWWGCNSGPNTAGCDTVNNSGGTLTSSPWITLTDTPSPSTVQSEQASTLTASVLQDSSSQTLTPADVSAMVGVTVSWGSATNGSLSAEEATIQTSGTATATLTPDGSCNNESASASVDNAVVAASVTVLCPDLSAVKTDSVGGSAVTGQPWTWTIDVANTGDGSAAFGPGDNVVLDNLPTGLTYASPVSSDPGLSCSISSDDLLCIAPDTYTLASGVTFSVQVAASGSSAATYANPRPGGTCAVDPDGVNIEVSGANTSCADSVAVSPDGTTTTITSNTPSMSVVGQPVTVAYKVSPDAPGAGTPTGNVTVSDGVDTCTASVAAGQCPLVITSAGSISITASYAGDANFNGSTSSPATAQVVGQASTSTAITSNTPDPSMQGQPVGVLFEVSVTAPGAGTPTGNVTVSDGVDSCSAPVAVGECSITLTTPGSRTLVASYSGDTNFLGSTSPGVPQTVRSPVGRAPTVTGVSPQQGPVTGHTPLTITGTNFEAGAVVWIGQSYVATKCIDVDVVSSTKITCSTSGGAEPGIWNLWVTTNGGMSPLSPADHFTYYALWVQSVSPDSGPVKGGTPVTITGNDFVAGSIVVFGQGHGTGMGSLRATDVHVVSGTKITAQTPKGAKASIWNVFVIVPGGKTSPPHPSDRYTYLATPGATR